MFERVLPSDTMKTPAKSRQSASSIRRPDQISSIETAGVVLTPILEVNHARGAMTIFRGRRPQIRPQSWSLAEQALMNLKIVMWHRAVGRKCDGSLGALGNLWGDKV